MAVFDKVNFMQVRAASEVTTDPTLIQDPTKIPPSGAQFVGLSSQAQVDVYCGTIPMDTDAQPAAKELLDTSLDTGGLSNADYIYNQVSALYGGNPLPSFKSPSGNDVKSIVFVSGSNQGGYGAFHIWTTQTDFDRIVVDSLTISGSYSAGSSLGDPTAHMTAHVPHLFPIYRGDAELLGVLSLDDPNLKKAGPKAIREALTIAAQSNMALKAAVETRIASLAPRKISSPTIKYLSTKTDLAETRQLIHANQDTLALLAAAAQANTGRQYLSTALFVAEIVESFQKLTSKADPGKTDGEAVSRVLAFKLTPEMALVPGFNSGVTQQWWKDGHPDFANDNSQNDQSIDGNAAGVMFLEFLTDYLGISMEIILRQMPASNGAPLGQTYVNLLALYPKLADIAGADGKSAFQKMVSLLVQYTQNPDGSLNLPAAGNPFSSMPGAKQGGLFAAQTPDVSSVAHDAQAALILETQLDQ
ncbi:MAG: hypothetical protein KGL95_04660, partial [Patescibacteria group bacterium]|nr:hypothetical protein [Patescibacteria group bacterium]